jgi:WhiB family redox-sensing transcriptional regulator
MARVMDSMGNRDLRWQDLAKCTEDGVDPDWFFPERGGTSYAAKTICGHCIVRAACDRYARENRESYGIWGGRSDRDRREARRVARTEGTAA